MPRKKLVNQDSSFSADDTNLSDSSILDDEDADSDDGLVMMMMSGSAVRTRPGGHGPDSDDFAYPSFQ